jgi:hypothetical protein
MLLNTYRYTCGRVPGHGEQIVYSLALQHQDKVLVEHIKTAALAPRRLPRRQLLICMRALANSTLRAMHHGN